MANKTDWEKQATNILKSELVRRGLNYEDLKAALENIGVVKTTGNITKTINLGKFSFNFFLQCAKAMGLDNIKFNLP